MPLVCVCSPKGGVGKTTVSANLAYALARSGSKVLVIDFDVQNALRLHFGVPISDTRGYVAQATTVMDWSQFILKADANLFVLPYSEADEEQRLAFENAISHDPHFLQRGLNTVLNYPGLVVIADFPPGPVPALKAVQSFADLHIVMMLADTASLSLLPQIENHKFLGAPLNQRLGGG
ncbi:cellulose synthase operon protein YhjQ, partial [Sodalis sp. TME1]